MANSEIKISHRFGKVFVRMVWKSKLGRQSSMAQLSPQQAEALGHNLVQTALRAHNRKPKGKLKLRMEAP